MQEKTDSIFILIIVLINSLLGFFQEYKAENTLQSLKKQINKTIKVYRDSKKTLILSEEIVVGDLIILEPGVRIPADGRVIEGTELAVNESLLTGESKPVYKTSKPSDEKNSSVSRPNYVLKGSSVLEGIGVIEVTATGNDTYFGKIAGNLSEELNPETPIKKEISKIGKIITFAIVIISIFIVIFGLLKGFDLIEISMTSIALGVSTIPEGLIIGLTVTLAIGMNRIMAKKAIVKNLPAAETLGDVDVLCVDKTGTLTEGNMKVTDIDFLDKKRAMYALALCNNDTNFIDKALAKYLNVIHNFDFIAKVQDKRKGIFPFSSINKYTGSYDQKSIYAIGAPEVIFKFCNKIDIKWVEKVRHSGKEGSRVIAVCDKLLLNRKTPSRDDFNNMNFLGLIFIKDPVRLSVKLALKQIYKAGIEVKVITGDLKETSISVLKAIDFPLNDQSSISGANLDQISDLDKFDKAVSVKSLFYRTTPDQKVKIVESLQRQGKRVGMMGDGINDSPALKKAEIGICVDSATDVSKEVADVVLIDSNFQTIVDAVEEGRNIFQNLRKLITYLFADSLSETILILSSIIAGLPLPLKPLHLLWINLVEDGLPSLALSFDNSKRGLLNKPPRSKSSSVFDKKVISAIIAISLVTDLIYFIIFRYFLSKGYSLDHAQTFIFAGVSLSSLVFLLSAKTIDSNIWKEKIFDNSIVNISILIGIILLFTAIYTPILQNILGTVALSSIDLITIFLLALIDTLFIELIKYFLHKN